MSTSKNMLELIEREHGLRYFVDQGPIGTHRKLDEFVFDQVEVTGISQTAASRWYGLTRWMPCLNEDVLVDGTFERGE